jgi:hypothetical protein
MREISPWKKNQRSAGGAVRFGAGLILVACLPACSNNTTATSSPDMSAAAEDMSVSPDMTIVWPAGSLIQVTMNSTVGVLLDELPSAQRSAIETSLIAKPDAFWTGRAKRQAKLTGLRLVFRTNYWMTMPVKDSLPIAPDSAWQITLNGKPARKMIGGHDLVAVDYTLTTMILADADSPAKSEPALAQVGGTWDEPFSFPADPELVFQRTRFACLNEGEFPPNSVDSEEVDSMYDHSCDVEPALTQTGCHQTELPSMSCVDTLDAQVGRIDTNVHFERKAYDPVVAASVRIGPVTSTAGADMTGIPEQFQVNRTIYRYIRPDSCTLVEQCVGAPGWRRLLQFTGSDKDVGGKALDIGAIDYFKSGSVASQLIAHNVYEWSACHGHYHFMHYGTFSFGDNPQTNAKRGFCLQSTNRFTNNEFGSLTNPYADCGYQGVGSGWGDEYRAGLECQWLDVTTETTSAAPVTKKLKFVANPDGFLCEGTLDLDANGMLQFTPTNFKTTDGKPVDKPLCNYIPGWFDNNTDEYDATVPLDGEGYVTAPCTNGQIGPLRNCELKKAPMASQVLSCTAGANITLDCKVPAGSAPQVVRVCDYSAKLKTSIPCTYQDSYANNLVVDGTDTQIQMQCPASRDADEPGGSVSIYQGPAYNDDPAADITCVVQ